MSYLFRAIFTAESGIWMWPYYFWQPRIELSDHSSGFVIVCIRDSIWSLHGRLHRFVTKRLEPWWKPTDPIICQRDPPVVGVIPIKQIFLYIFRNVSALCQQLGDYSSCIQRTMDKNLLCMGFNTRICMLKQNTKKPPYSNCSSWFSRTSRTNYKS